MHLDELVGYFDEMMADTLDKAGRTTVKDGVVQNKNREVFEGLSETEKKDGIAVADFIDQVNQMEDATKRTKRKKRNAWGTKRSNKRK